MRHHIGFGMLALSLPCILLGILDVTSPVAVLIGITLGSAGVLVAILGRDDRRRLLNFDAVLNEPEPPRLKEVRRPPPLPKVSVDTTGVPVETATRAEETGKRPGTMLPPPMGDEERRAGIKLVHTDGRRLILRNRPRRTG